MAADTLFLNGHIATMAAGGAPYGAIADGALAVTDGRIAWAGPRAELPSSAQSSTTLIHDMAGGWLTPGLIDCHTHLIFAGERSAEFEARLGGISYEQAAKAGRGILSTVAATRAASEASLIAAGTKRLRRLMADGVTTVEIKSGYGLTLDDELKMLRAARALGQACGVRVRTSLLAVHAVPPEFAGRPDAYLDHVIGDIMPAAAREKLADAVDAFAETVAFSPVQVTRLFTAAKALDLPVKLHADQLSDGGGAALAASFGALSADHLEYTSQAGAAAMAQSGTVAVLLPGAYATVGAAQPPPVAAFRAHGVPMAVATDCNPGSSPLGSLLLAVNLACCLFRLTPEEALAGVTRHAASALGLQRETGTLEAGKAADLALWPVQHPRELAYWMGGMAPVVTMAAGDSEPMMKYVIAIAALAAGPVHAATAPAVMAYYEGAASNASLRHFAGDIQIIAADRFDVDATGTVSGSIPPSVLAVAAAHHIQLLATFSNFGSRGFSAAIAHAVLTPGAAQDRAVTGMLKAAQGTAGINLDFESVHRTDRAAYTAFAQRLAAAAHANGMTLVLSVPAESQDNPRDGWTGAYDYAALGKIADLMQVMTYDENGPWSAPGPVAGLDWVSACLAFSQSVVPAGKISLGVPAYGYDWNLTAGTGVQIAFKAVPALLQRSGSTPHWDAQSSSPWFHYKSAGGASHVVWYENPRSIALKSALAHAAAIQGVSIYALGFDNKPFWNALGKP